MEILETFNFDERPSRSRYAGVVKALVEQRKHAVKLTRGADFPVDVKIDTVQAGVSTAVRKAGKRARTRVVSDDELVVGLADDRPARKRALQRAVAVA